MVEKKDKKARLASYVIPVEMREQIKKMTYIRMFGTNRSAYIRHLVTKDVADYEAEQSQKGS